MRPLVFVLRAAGAPPVEHRLLAEVFDSSAGQREEKPGLTGSLQSVQKNAGRFGGHGRVQTKVLWLVMRSWTGFGVFSLFSSSHVGGEDRWGWDGTTDRAQTVVRFGSVGSEFCCYCDWCRLVLFRLLPITERLV